MARLWDELEGRWRYTRDDLRSEERQWRVLHAGDAPVTHSDAQRATDALAAGLLALPSVSKWQLVRIIAVALGVQWCDVAARAHEMGGQWIDNK